MRLTCSSLSLYSATIGEAIAVVSELRFPAIDVVGIPTFVPTHLDVASRDAAELRALTTAVKAAGIEVASIVTVPTDGLERWDADEIDARVGWAVRACEAVGAGRLVLDAGTPVAADPALRPVALDRWKAMFDTGFALTAAAGVALAVEAPHTGTLAETYHQVAELLAVLDRPSVGVDYDTSHVYRSGASIDESLRLVGDRVVKVALRDVDADGEFCRPGQGGVDFRRLLALLEARGYEGDLVIELETPGIEAVADQRREIELARAYVDQLLTSL
jgi:sugar phosphate isomerase/epimerase